MTVDGETIEEVDGYEIFDPKAVWKRKKLYNFEAKNLRVQLFDKGKNVHKPREIEEIKVYCKNQIDSLWDEMLRFDNPQTYYVDLSQKLYDMKQNLIKELHLEN